ncbi:hypothetical protein [Bdellovibrio sp. NC01]|uniref:hypothetical protein n=1 Tax=Bdellovibrio sp. NC01 TaxID=2220073 RepID=UPI001159821D|nr:hypothetical protein [Bdellovibrio sp. NC01]QDK37174.1 hypothetical protein DOE51_06005 [Bdellovibrio sp. NC01]
MMKRVKQVLGLLILALFLTAADWGLPNTPSTAIGDAGTLYLADPSFLFEIHNNDWIGQTDKLLTFSSNLAYYRNLQTKAHPSDPTPEAFAVILGSRLLTPIIKTRFDQEDLPQPEGVLAEWLALQISYSRLIGRMKFELSFEGDFFGNYHADDIYRTIHEMVASPDDWDRFGERKEGTYGAGSVGLGYLWNDFLLSTVYYDRSIVMEDYTIQTSFVWPFSDNFSFAAENRLVFQTYSQLYKDERPYRQEWSLALKWGFWQGNFKYVSPYLEKDRWGQYFLSPLILSWKF